MDVERDIAAGSRVNRALAALMRWRNVNTAAPFGRIQCSVGTDAVIGQRNMDITEEE